MIRFLLLVTLAILPTVSTLAQAADPPPKAAEPPTPEQRRELEAQVQAKSAAATKAEDADGLAAARKLRQEVLDLTQRLYGPNDWRATDARLARAHVDVLAKLNAAQRKELREGRDLMAREKLLSDDGKFAEAEALCRKALAVRTRLLGEEHCDTAASASRLAGNLESLGKNAEAESLARKALDTRRKLLGEEHPDTAATCRVLASILDDLAKYAEAEALSRKSLAIRRKLLGEEHIDTAESCRNLADILQNQGKYAEADPLCRQLLEIRRKVLGEEHRLTVFAYNTLAYNLEHQGKLAEANTLQRKALDIARKVLGEDNADTASCYNNLGGNLAEQGKYAEAEALYRTALAIREKIFGAEHRVTAGSYNNVAFILNVQAKYVEAEPFYRRALAIHQKVRGEEHPDTARSYNNLAFNVEAQGKYADAEVLHRKALAIRRKVLGENHPDVAQSCNNLATLLSAQSKYAEAEPLFRQAVDIYRTALGEEHLNTLRSYNNLAVNLDEQGKYTEAEPLHRRVLAGKRKALGEEHPETAASYNNVATNLNYQGKHAEAEPLFRQALAIKQKALGKEHPDTAFTCQSLAFTLKSLGKYAEAESLYREALAIRRKVLGESHPVTAASYDGLAGLLEAESKYAEAEPLFRQALAIRQRMLGENHRDTAFSYGGLAANLNDQGKYAEAEPLFRRSLAVMQKVLGEEHPETITCYENVAFTLSLRGKYAEAEPIYRKALAIREKVLGENHPSTATSCTNLSINLNAQGKYAEAELLGRRSLAIARKSLGEDHPETATSYNNLAFVLNAQGKYAEAEPLLHKGLAIELKLHGRDHRNTATHYNNLAFNLNAQGKYGEALAMARLGAQTFMAARQSAASSGLERSNFGAGFSPVALLATCLARAGQPADAWLQLETYLARGLFEDLNAPRRRRMTADERRTEDDLRGRVAQLDKQVAALDSLPQRTPEQAERLERLRHEAEELQAKLARHLADMTKRYDDAAAGAVYDLARIQKQLPADTAAVTWLDFDKLPDPNDPRGHHWACVVRSSGPPVWVRLAGSGEKGAWTNADKDLLQQVRDLFQGSAGRRPWEDLSNRLASLRLAPLEEHLRADESRPAVQHLIVLPSPALAGIPVEALTDRYSISYAPSATMFAYLEENRLPAAPGALLALGDPVFPPPPPALPHLTPPAQGVVVREVTPGSNGLRAGLQPGDVLLSYAGTGVASIPEVLKAIAAHAGDAAQPGLSVEFWRQGQTRTTSVPPGRLGIFMSAGPPPEALQALWDAAEALQRSTRGAAFTPLPGTRREVASIVGLFPDHKELLGSDASEQQLDTLARNDGLSKYRYLHLATHGIADTTRGLNSYLALARDHLPDPLTVPPPGQKLYTGELSAEDVLLHWKLNAELVTLSACETGLGQKQGGEGFVGFSQALFIAGARSVVLSQWKVDDQATALLMQRFYQNLLGQRPGLEQPLGKAAALAEAKRWLRQLDAEEVARMAKDLPGARGLEVVPTTPEPGSSQPYAHPYYWAAFILVGDPGDVTQAVPVLAGPMSAAGPSNLRAGQSWLWLTLAGVGAALGGLLLVMRRKQSANR